MEEVVKVLAIMTSALIICTGIVGALAIILKISLLLSDAVSALKNRVDKISHGIVVEKNSYTAHGKAVYELTIVGRKNNKIVEHRVRVWIWSYFNYNVGDYYSGNALINRSGGR